MFSKGKYIFFLNKKVIQKKKIKKSHFLIYLLRLINNYLNNLSVTS